MCFQNCTFQNWKGLSDIWKIASVLPNLQSQAGRSPTWKSQTALNATLVRLAS